MNYSSRFKGSLIGMAVGDAYGTTFEFTPRYAIQENQLSRDDFMGGGKFRLMKGMFTDDTSLALVQAESLLDFYSINNNNQVVVERLQKLFRNIKQQLEAINENTTCLRGYDIIEKSLRWYNDGHFSSEGSCFDIGSTTLTYLNKNFRNNQPFCLENEKRDNASGNGALMRLAPVPLYFYGLYLKKKNEINSPDDDDDDKLAYLLHRVIEESGFSSMTTHPSQIAIDCNRYMAALLIGCLQNATKEQLLEPLFVPKGLPTYYWELFPLRKEVHDLVSNCEYKTATSDQIKNGGFSVFAFKSALWGFFKFNTYMDGLIEIVKLGDDSDTAGAIYGQLAGCFYGIESIPQNLVSQCVYSKFICLIADELLRAPHTIGENTWAYINVMKVFEVLENEYYKIHRRSLPSPRSFKSNDEFVKSVNDMKAEYLKYKEGIFNRESNIDNNQRQIFEDVAESLFQDFIKRCREYTLKKVEILTRSSQHPASLFKKNLKMLNKFYK